MGGRPGEVSPRWAARRLGLCVHTIRRWCVEERLRYIRAELGAPLATGERHVIRYWLSRDEINGLWEEGRPASERIG